MGTAQRVDRDELEYLRSAIPGHSLVEIGFSLADVQGVRYHSVKSGP
jgi:hypothetical protein